MFRATSTSKVSFIMEIFKKWIIDIRQSVIIFDRLCGSLTMKKITSPLLFNKKTSLTLSISSDLEHDWSRTETLEYNRYTSIDDYPFQSSYPSRLWFCLIFSFDRFRSQWPIESMLLLLLPISMAFSRHSQVTWTSFLASSLTLPTKSVSLRSPWYPRWYTVMSTVGSKKKIEG